MGNEQEIEKEPELEDLTESELEELAEALLPDQRLAGGAAPSLKEKQDIMNFFNKVLDTDNTTKVSNLNDEELLSVRLMQRAALYCLEVNYVTVAKYIQKRAEIVLATALSGKSKGGFFLNIINTSKRLLESKTSRGADSGSQGGKKKWFGR